MNKLHYQRIKRQKESSRMSRRLQKLERRAPKSGAEGGDKESSATPESAEAATAEGVTAEGVTTPPTQD